MCRREVLGGYISVAKSNGACIVCRMSGYVQIGTGSQALQCIVGIAQLRFQRLTDVYRSQIMINGRTARVGTLKTKFFDTLKNLKSNFALPP